MAGREELRARKALAALRSFVRRTGLTGWTDRSARHQFERALQAVAELEDAVGVDAAAVFSERLDALRREAIDAGLLSAGDVLDAERALLAQ